MGGLGSQVFSNPVRTFRKKISIDPVAFKSCGSVPIVLFPDLPVNKFYNLIDVFCTGKQGPGPEAFSFDALNSTPIIKCNNIPAPSGFLIDAIFINTVGLLPYITGCKTRVQANSSILQANGAGIILTTVDGGDSATGDSLFDLYLDYSIENAKV